MSRMSGKQRLRRMIWVCAICTSLGYKQYASSLDKDLLIHIHSRIRTFILYVRKIPLHTSNFSTQKYNFLYLYHACCVFRFRITVLSYAGPLVLQWHYQTSFYAMEPNLWNRPLRTSIFETQRNVSSLCVCAFRRNMSKMWTKLRDKAYNKTPLLQLLDLVYWITTHGLADIIGSYSISAHLLDLIPSVRSSYEVSSVIEWYQLIHPTGYSTPDQITTAIMCICFASTFHC